MKEHKRKIVEGLKPLIEGLLDETEDLRIFTNGSEKEVLQFRRDNIKNYLNEAERICYFPEIELEILKLKYNIINNRINRK